METKHLSRTWRLLVTPVVAVALLVGYVAVADGGSSPRRPVGAVAPTKLTARDLLLAATRTRNGIFLQFDGVTGPPSPDHAMHAPLLSFQWGASRASSISGGAREFHPPSVSDITVTKTTDKYSVPLMTQSLMGDGSANAVIYFTKASADGRALDYLEFDLQNVLVSSFSMSSGGDRPTESISLNFTKVTIKAHISGAAAQTVNFDLLAQPPIP